MTDSICLGASAQSLDVMKILVIAAHSVSGPFLHKAPVGGGELSVFSADVLMVW